MSQTPALPIPFRLAVLKALCAEIETVVWRDQKPGERNLTGAVFRGRTIFGEDDPLPMISILEVPQQADGVWAGNDGSSVKGRWDLVIQGFVQDDHLHPTDPGHYFMAAVKKALGAIRRQASADAGILGFKGLVDDITFNSGVVRPPDETSAVAHFWLTVYLEMVEDVSDPYVEQ